MSQSERQQNLLETLCRRRYDTCSNLAEEFHVSKATIYRDVVDLMRSYPIETVRGHGGGIKIADGYFNRHDIGRKSLSPQQTALLKKLREYIDGEDLDIMNDILIQFAP